MLLIISAEKFLKEAEFQNFRFSGEKKTKKIFLKKEKTHFNHIYLVVSLIFYYLCKCFCIIYVRLWSLSL